MSNAVLKADGNIRIPAALRKAVGAELGQTFDLIAKGSMIVLVPAVDVRSLRGSASGADTSDFPERWAAAPLASGPGRDPRVVVHMSQNRKPPTCGPASTAEGRAAKKARTRGGG